MSAISTSSANSAIQLQQWRGSQSGPSTASPTGDEAFAELESSVQAQQSSMFSSLLLGTTASSGVSGDTSSTAAAGGSATLQSELSNLVNAATNGLGSAADASTSAADASQATGGAHHHHHHQGASSDTSTDSLTPTTDQLIDGNDPTTTSPTAGGLPQFLLDALASGQTPAGSSSQGNAQASPEAKAQSNAS